MTFVVEEMLIVVVNNNQKSVMEGKSERSQSKIRNGFLEHKEWPEALEHNGTSSSSCPF